MSLNKRGEIWHLYITAPDGTPIRRSTGTKDRRQAQELHDKLKAELWRVDKLGERPSKTWDEAAYQWILETAGKKTHLEDVAKIKWLTPLLRGLTLQQITREKMIELTSSKGNSTANRYTALVRAIMYRAKNAWKWVDTVPAYYMRKEAKRRIRNLTREQIQTLLSALPEHQCDIAIFALATGLRQGNVLALEWGWINMDLAVAYIPDTKNGEPLGVPLNQTAMAILRKWESRRCNERVFTYRKKSLRRVNTKAWRNALLVAGITNFRWHDLRHVWACWQVQNGTPLFALQEMAGWKSEAMVRRYAHLSVDHLREYSDVAGLLHKNYTVAEGLGKEVLR